jgi:hypothetical protein
MMVWVPLLGRYLAVGDPFNLDLADFLLADAPDARLPERLVDAKGGERAKSLLLVKHRLVGDDEDVGRRLILAWKLRLIPAFPEERALPLLPLRVFAFAAGLLDRGVEIHRQPYLLQVQAHWLPVCAHRITAANNARIEPLCAKEIGDALAEAMRRHQIAPRPLVHLLRPVRPWMLAVAGHLLDKYTGFAESGRALHGMHRWRSILDFGVTKAGQLDKHEYL